MSGRALGVCFFVVVFLAASTVLFAAGPTPVWEFKFNDNASGSKAVNTGSDPNAANAYLTMRATSGGTGNWRVADGPSGLPGDYSLSSVASGTIHYADVPGTQVGGIAGFSKVTLCGWYKAAQPVVLTPQYNRVFLIGNRHEWDQGMVIDFNSQDKGYNQIGMEVNDYYNRAGDGGGDAYAGPVTNDTGVWRFWAVTYDGVPTSNNVNMYMGTRTQATSLLGVGTMSHVPIPDVNMPMNNPTGIIRNADGDFVLSGNIEWGYSNGFIGYQDNIRIFNGILTQSEIDSFRQADLAPEPASLCLLALGGLLGLRRRR